MLKSALGLLTWPLARSLSLWLAHLAFGLLNWPVACYLAIGWLTEPLLAHQAFSLLTDILQFGLLNEHLLFSMLT